MTNLTVFGLLILALVANAQVLTNSQVLGTYGLNVYPGVNGITVISSGISGLPGAGKCPRVVPGSTAICLDLCKSDSECAPVLQKCCSNGCGRECRNVYGGIVPEVHPGFCPAMRLDQQGICLLPCQFDGDCAPSYKCCIASGCPTFTCQPASSTAISPMTSLFPSSWPFGRK